MDVLGPGAKCRTGTRSEPAKAPVDPRVDPQVPGTNAGQRTVPYVRPGTIAARLQRVRDALAEATENSCDMERERERERLRDTRPEDK